MLTEYVLFDAGILIGALLRGDPRHAEARPLVEAARSGTFQACATSGILSEVYAALTWAGACPQHSPDEAAYAVRLLIEPPSELRVLSENLDAALLMLDLAKKYRLTARRIHDARHAAIAIASGVHRVYTYDVGDWQLFDADGISIIGPTSVLKK